MLKKLPFFLISILIFSYSYSQKASSIKQVKIKTVEEYIEVEAESFQSQDLTKNRAWYITSDERTKKIKPDPDKKHIGGASNRTYIEVLPETFTDKSRTMREGVNFSRTPGKVAVLNYKVNFKTTGKFYVWVKGYCSSTLDNSIHVGMDDKWKESGTGLYFCDGQDKWSWSSYLRNRTDDCDPNAKRAYIIVNRPGTHTIQFSMREDGFEFDKFVLTKERGKKPR